MGANNFMSKLTELNTETGLTYCGGMEEIYYEILEEYFSQKVENYENNTDKPFKKILWKIKRN